MAIRYLLRIPILLVLMPLGITAAAAAAPSPTSSSPTLPRTLSVYPAQEADTTLPGHFRYNLVAGASAQDGLVVQNFTAGPLSVSIYPADLVEVSNGGVAPSQQGATLHGVGSWITVSEPTLTLQPHTQATVAFTVKVPVGVTPENNEGAIVAQANVGESSNVGVTARVALLVEADVPGTAAPSGTVQHLKEDKTSTDTSKRFDVTLTNTGNVMLIQAGAVVVRDASGDVATRLPLSPQDGYAIPGGTLHLVSTPWTPPDSGRFTLQAEVPVTYSTAQGPRNAGTLISNTLAYTFTDWRLIGLEIAAGLIVLVMLGRLFVNWQRRRRTSAETRAEATRDEQARKKAVERLRNL